MARASTENISSLYFVGIHANLPANQVIDASAVFDTGAISSIMPARFFSRFGVDVERLLIRLRDEQISRQYFRTVVDDEEIKKTESYLCYMRNTWIGLFGGHGIQAEKFYFYLMSGAAYPLLGKDFIQYCTLNKSNETEIEFDFMDSGAKKYYGQYRMMNAFDLSGFLDNVL